MHETILEMAGKLSKRDADLMVGWMRHRLADLVAQGLEISLERTKKAATLTLRAPEEALLQEATDQVLALSSESMREG